MLLINSLAANRLASMLIKKHLNVVVYIKRGVVIGISLFYDFYVINLFAFIICCHTVTQLICLFSFCICFIFGQPPLYKCLVSEVRSAAVGSQKGQFRSVFLSISLCLGKCPTILFFRWFCMCNSGRDILLFFPNYHYRFDCIQVVFLSFQIQFLCLAFHRFLV